MSTETPNTVHGRLLEAVHISGYTFERACAELEWLLDEDRWKSVGSGYADINGFLATVDFSEFRIALDQRKKLAKRLQEIDASQRATARLLGVDEGTVRGDLGKKPRAEHSADQHIEAPKESVIEADIVTSAEHSAWFQADADPTLDAKRIVKQQANKDKLAAIHQVTEKPAGVFDVVYADPAWAYSNSGFTQSAAAQYPTLSVAAIASLPETDPTFPTMAMPAALFLWVPAPLLPDGLTVMAAWGFAYKSHFVWLKNRAPGIGWWLETRHELLLIGVRGDFPPAVREDSVITAPVGKHSEKPPEAYARIERMYPSASKVELFARAERDGWARWGFEA